MSSRRQTSGGPPPPPSSLADSRSKSVRGGTDWNDLKVKVERAKMEGDMLRRSRSAAAGMNGAGASAGGRSTRAGTSSATAAAGEGGGDNTSLRSGATRSLRSAMSNKQQSSHESRSARMMRGDREPSFRKKSTSAWSTYQTAESRVKDDGVDGGPGGPGPTGSPGRRNRKLTSAGGGGSNRESPQPQAKTQNRPRRQSSREDSLERRPRLVRRSSLSAINPPTSSQQSDDGKALSTQPAQQQQPVSILKRSNFGKNPKRNVVRRNSADSVTNNLWGPSTSTKGDDMYQVGGSSRHSSKIQQQHHPRPTSFSTVARAAAGNDSKDDRTSSRDVLGMKVKTQGRESGIPLGDKLSNLEGNVKLEGMPSFLEGDGIDKSNRSLDLMSAYTGRSTRTQLTAVSEFSTNEKEEEANRKFTEKSRNSKFVTFFEEDNGDKRRYFSNQGGNEGSTRSTMTDLSEDVEPTKPRVNRSTRSLEASEGDTTTSSFYGSSTVTSGIESSLQSETTMRISNKTGAMTKGGGGGDGLVPLQVRGRSRNKLSESQPSGEEARETRRSSVGRALESEDSNLMSSPRHSVDDMAWKLGSTPCIFLGGVHNVGSSPEDAGKSPALRMHDGLVLSAGQHFNYRSQLFDLRQEEEEEDGYDTDESGCLVMEGPPPNVEESRLEPQQQQQLWWSVRVPVWKLGSEDDSGVDESILPLLNIKSVSDIGEAHAVVAMLLKSGRFAEGIHFLYNTIIASLRSRPEIQEEWDSTINGGDLINMALRNIGTIELWIGRLEESSHSLYHVVNREEGSGSLEDVLASHDAKSAFLAASSLTLLGLSMYALEDYEEANSALIKSLSELEQILIPHSRRNSTDHSTGHGSLDSLEETERIQYAAAKILNNIGCVFFELGFYKSACRALHRSLLVFLSKDLECGCPTLNLDDSLENRNPPFPSLTDVMNAFKTKKIKMNTFRSEHQFDVAITLCNLGNLLVKRSKYSAASVCVKSAESVLSEKLGEHHPVSYTMMEGLAYLNIKMHRYERALRVYEQMLELEEKRGAPSKIHHLTIAKLLGKMSFTYLRMHKTRAALACLKGVLANQEAALPPDDSSIAQTRSFMADIKARLKKERESREK